MRNETREAGTRLRSGFTTGACATAASVAAANRVFGHAGCQHVQIRLPGGRTVEFQIASCRELADGAEATVIKDAGDDPDITHGATIRVHISLTEKKGVLFVAGAGVGTVTRPGLVLQVGEPAINPVPRQMIRAHLAEIAQRENYSGGFRVRIGVENGEQLATRTMNPRLGIVGGLSILGTTGIVRPFSCSAYIASIHQGIDVARANGSRHLAACTGSQSEQFVDARYELPEYALIEMGDFVGALLKHLKTHPVDRLTIAGGFGKISKFAAGSLNLHSRSSSIDFDFLAELAGTLGATETLAGEIRQCNTSQQAAAIASLNGIPLADRICRLGYETARRFLPSTDLEVWALDRESRVLGHCRSRS